VQPAVLEAVVDMVARGVREISSRVAVARAIMAVGLRMLEVAAVVAVHLLRNLNNKHTYGSIKRKWSSIAVAEVL
jgi:predicted transcriptional regulator